MGLGARTNDAEWVGGLFPFAGTITGEGEPYRPDVLVWIDGSGAVRGMEVARPGEWESQVQSSFAAAMKPQQGPALPRPSRVRVQSERLAAALRLCQPGLAVVLGPTPEVDAVRESMEARFGDSRGPRAYLEAGLESNAVASLFEAAAALFRAAPWKVVPDDMPELLVSCPALGLSGGVLHVTGHLGQSLGFTLFENDDDFMRFHDVVSEANARGQSFGDAPLDVPPHVGLTFVPVAELTPKLLSEVRREGWPIAGDDAYPALMSVEPGPKARSPRPAEVTRVDALCRALTSFLELERAALERGFQTGTPVTRTVPVQVCGKRLEVTLTAPLLFDDEPHLQPGLLAALQALETPNGIPDAEAREALERLLLARFSASAEGRAFERPLWSECVLRLAAVQLGRSVGSLRAAEFDTVVFSLIPRKVSVQAGAAKEIVTELRAFVRWLGKAHRWPSVDACLEVLGGDAVRRLKRELGNGANFGPAKSLLMGAMAAGVDVHSQEQMAAYVEKVNAGRPRPPRRR